MDATSDLNATVYEQHRAHRAPAQPAHRSARRSCGRAATNSTSSVRRRSSRTLSRDGTRKARGRKGRHAEVALAVQRRSPSRRGSASVTRPMAQPTVPIACHGPSPSPRRGARRWRRSRGRRAVRPRMSFSCRLHCAVASASAAKSALLWRRFASPRWDRAAASAALGTRTRGQRSERRCQRRPRAACPPARCRPSPPSRCMTASRRPRSFPK